MHCHDREQPRPSPAPDEHFLVVELLEVALDRPLVAQCAGPEEPPVAVPVEPEPVPVPEVEAELVDTAVWAEVPVVPVDSSPFS
jgi:hypothetical protein